MASDEKAEDRHAVPRLRSFAAAVGLNELNSSKPLQENPFTAQMLADRLDDWALEPGISVAADLVSTGIAVGREGLAVEAARFLIDQEASPPLAKKMAAVCLGEADPAEISIGSKSLHAEAFSAEGIHDRIHRTKLQLNSYIRDAVLWVNLASLYVSIGQERPALRAVRVALSLEPQNRFVLRSTARMLLHFGRGDEASAILQQAEGLRTDPWILAAEVSICAAIKRASDHLKFAQHIIEGDKFSPYDLSELSAELATIRALDGNTHAAKKLLRRSMQKPCENAIAQAAWLSRVPGMPAMPEEQTTSFEANAWVARQNGNLKESLQQTRHWLADQPFSHGPAQMGSFVASRIADNRASIRFAEKGLVCNPENFTLLNNLAFSTARSNDLGRAKATLHKVKKAELTEIDEQVLRATQGLIAYREGEIDRGRALYEEAIVAFRKVKDAREAVAMTYQAMEEIHAGTERAEQSRAAALAAGKKLFRRLEDTLLIEQLENFDKKS